MFWVKYFSFAVKEGVKNTHCECGDEATARELLPVLPTLQNRGTTLPIFECAFYCTLFITYLHIYSHFIFSTFSNKEAINITFLEINYSAVVTYTAPPTLKDYIDT